MCCEEISCPKCSSTKRVLFVSPNTVLKTLRAAAAAILGLPVTSKVRDLQIDEFWSFVGSKRRL